MSNSRKLWVTLLASALLFGAAVVPLEGLGRPGRALLDAAHLPAFVVVTWILRRLLLPGHALWRDLVVAAAAGLLGAAIEAAQMLGPRSASVGDLWRDGLAIVATLLWLRAARTPWPVAVVLRVGAVGLIGLGLWPLGQRALDERARAEAFPLLLRAGTGWSQRALDLRDFTLVDPAGFGFECQSGDNPALILHTFRHDWSAQRALILRVELDRTKNLHLRIDDAEHDGRYGDRYDGTFLLSEGVHEVRIELAEIAAAPRDRSMDLSRIVALAIHFEGGPLKLRLLELRLSDEPAPDATAEPSAP